jgi:LysM repeat protein
MIRKIIYILLIAVAAVVLAVVAFHAVAIAGVYELASLKNAKPAEPATAGSSGGFYTVIKGDTPLSISKKLHVSYAGLLRLNQVTDARKLQIGQKLRIPAEESHDETNPDKD